MSKSFYFSLKPLIPYWQSSRPLDLDRQFGRKAFTEVEIGFGIGEYFVRVAGRHPERNFLGIDNSWVASRRTMRKIAQTNLVNVRLLLADARLAFERLLKPRSIQRVYALFPCPWPKKRHIKYRLFSADFLRILNSRLKARGEFQLVSDHKTYVDWVVQEAVGTGFSVDLKSVPARFDTKYERKWQEHGQKNFYELRLIKEKPCKIKVKGDEILKTYRLDLFNPENFAPANQSGEHTVVFKEFIFDAKRQKALSEVITVEEGLRQHFWVAISREKGKWNIHVSSGSMVIPSEAVKEALELVYQAAVKSGAEES